VNHAGDAAGPAERGGAREGARNRAEAASAGDWVELRPFLGSESLVRAAM
jgi:hypothetical protein